VDRLLNQKSVKNCTAMYLRLDFNKGIISHSLYYWADEMVFRTLLCEPIMETITSPSSRNIIER